MNKKYIHGILTLLLGAASVAAGAEAPESQKKWGVFSKGLKVGLGMASAKAKDPAFKTENGLAFNAGVFTSFGWRSRIQLQPEINFMAHETGSRDELFLGSIPSGLFRDTSFELSELQFGLLLKLGKPRWADALKKKGRRRRALEMKGERRWLPYVSGGAMVSRVLESKRLVRLDTSGAIAKSDQWVNDSRLNVQWVAAVGYEYTRAAGGGVGVEARWQLRDLPLETGLGSDIKISTYRLSVILLF